MLATPRTKETPLRDAVRETIHYVPTTSIPAFIEKGLRALEQDAQEILAERKALGLPSDLHMPKDKT
jgi:hypothetical protein